MSKSAKLPITNVLVGDYTAQLEIGAEKNIANVILDTGSSTLAVWRNKFGNITVEPTNFVQFVGYGTGHWAGPILKAQVGFGSGSNYISLASTTIAQIQSGLYRGEKQFHPADGILGLAFKSLNTAVKVGSNYPISRYDTQNQWSKLVYEYGVEHIDPYFTDLKKAGLVENKYAFLTRRSITNQSVDPQNDPLNQGWFILGGGEEYKELYTGSFQSLQVVSDEYWNTQFIQIQVGTDTPIAIPSLSQLEEEYGQNLSYMGSNSIIDSGTNSIQLTNDAYQSMLQSFKTLDRLFYNTINQSAYGISLTATELESWPSIFVTLAGTDGSPVTLEMKPETYWQTNASQSGVSIFNIRPGGQAQSILGLPLMNNYYVIFERGTSDQGLGKIKFAAQNPSGYHAN
ncbi:MAG: pepsin-like aspartic protease [Cyanobacteria bacterium P01_G01_bin.54]